jgi:hypothetical protein
MGVGRWALRVERCAFGDSALEPMTCALLPPFAN